MILTFLLEDSPSLLIFLVVLKGSQLLESTSDLGHENLSDFKYVMKTYLGKGMTLATIVLTLKIR